MQNMCYYFLHESITKLLSAAECKPIEILSMTTRSKSKDQTIMSIFCHLMIRNHPQLVNSSISNETLLVPDPD